MKIEIWSDVACPYCYVGFIHLQMALHQFKGDRPEIILRSFELEPDIAINGGETQHEAVMRKYQQSALQARQTLDSATNAGRTAGLTIDFEKVITTNTFNAHRLIHYAEKLQLGPAMKTRLFRAYFSEGKHIGDKAVLVTLAEDLGIDAKNVMDSDRFAAEVRKDEHRSYSMGIRAVPFVLCNERFTISGAQPVGTYLELLNELQTKTPENGRADSDPEQGYDNGTCRG
jgi:predicted DsbA family dithiol-disulfide isomerase